MKEQNWKSPKFSFLDDCSKPNEEDEEVPALIHSTVMERSNASIDKRDQRHNHLWAKSMRWKNKKSYEKEINNIVVEWPAVEEEEGLAIGTIIRGTAALRSAVVIKDPPAEESTNHFLELPPEVEKKGFAIGTIIRGPSLLP